MKVTVGYPDLLDALTWVNKTTGKHVTPIMAGMKLSVAASTLTIGGTDYETIRRRHIDGARTADGEVLISGPALTAAVRAMPRGDVTLTARKNELVVTGSNTKVGFPYLEGDYPGLPDLPEGIGLLDGTRLAWSIMRVGVSASHEPLLPTINCIHIRVDGPTLVLTATDRYRAASDCLVFDSPPADDREMLLSARELMAFAQTGLNGPVMLHAGSEYGALSTPAVSLMTRDLTTAGGEFPRSLEKMMAADVASAVVCPDAANMTHAVDRARAMIGKHGLVRLEFNGAAVTVVGVKAGDDVYKEELPCKAMLGDPPVIQFNGKYLSELLAYIGGPVGLGMNGPAKPAQIMPADQEDPFRGLLIPLTKEAS